MREGADEVNGHERLRNQTSDLGKTKKAASEK
jgi:hypothetical protein